MTLILKNWRRNFFRFYVKLKICTSLNPDVLDIQNGIQNFVIDTILHIFQILQMLEQEKQLFLRFVLCQNFIIMNIFLVDRKKIIIIEFLNIKVLAHFVVNNVKINTYSYNLIIFLAKFSGTFDHKISKAYINNRPDQQRSILKKLTNLLLIFEFS